MSEWHSTMHRKYKEEAKYSRHLLFCFLVFVILLSSCSIMDPYIRLESLLRKGKYDLLAYRLNKIQSSSDSNISEAYIKSLHFATPNSPFYSPDSSYTWAKKGKSSWPNAANRKRRMIHRRINESNDPFDYLIKKSDSLAFELAQVKNTEKSFNHYLNFYERAKFEKKAILKRDSLAFDYAKRENTYLSYKNFLDKYPKSKEAEAAKEIYQLLLYETHTRDKQLASFENFVRDFPNSPYCKEALKYIFQYYTIDNRKSSYQKYLDRYPKSPKAYEAKLWLESFATSRDSIASIIWPVNKTQKFALYNLNDCSLSIALDSLISMEFCKSNFEDHVIYIDEDKYGLINNEGLGLIPAVFSDLKHISSKVLAYQADEEYGLIHTSGFRITPPIYDDIIALNDTFILGIIDSTHFLLAHNGLRLFESKADSILELVPGILNFHDGGKNTLFKSNDFIYPADKPQSEQIFEYVERFGNSLLTKKENTYTLIDSSFYELFGGIISYQKNQEYLLISWNDSSQIIDLDGNQIQSFQMDSANTNFAGFTIFHDSLISCFCFDTLYTGIREIREFKPLYFELRNGDSTRFLLTEETNINTSDFDAFSLLSNPQQSDYYTFQFKKEKEIGIITKSGEILFKGEYEEVSVRNDSTFRVKKDNRYFLLNRLGEKIIRQSFEAIDLTQKHGITLFQNGKFGMYLSKSDHYIKAQFKRPIRLIDENKMLLSLSQENGKAILYQADISETLDIEGEDFEVLNDSLIFVKNNFQWLLYNLEKEALHRPEIACDSYKLVNDSLGNTDIVFLKSGSYGYFNTERNEYIYPEFYQIFDIRNKDGEISHYLTVKYYEEIEFYLFQLMNKSFKEVIRSTVPSTHIENSFGL